MKYQPTFIDIYQMSLKDFFDKCYIFLYLCEQLEYEEVQSKAGA